MPYPYIDTPRTEVDGNATYLTNGNRSAGRTHLSALDSVENSFQSPSKDEDIVKVIQDGRKRNSGGFKLTTPRAGTGPKTSRSALDKRQLPTAAPAKGEFTPLMQSATRNNMKNMLGARGGGGPKTPSYLKSNYRSNQNTPGLPEMSAMHEAEDTGDQATPVPQIASSSAQSTPLPKTGGLLNDGQNMTLKEQEKVIDKLEKENFGLKLKIYYMQEHFEKAGPEYNQTALKENTELKVGKLTMQRDMSRYKKGLLQAERDLQSYRLQVQELREKNRKRQMDETAQQEMDIIRQEAETKDAQIKDLQNELRDMKNKHSEMQEVLDDAERGVEEKELLRSRHRALTDESGGLQRDLSNAQSTIRELQGAVDDLSNDLRSERQMLEEQRGDLLSAKEDLRITKREEAALKNKVQSLEDEITVLQASLEEQQEQHNLDDARKREKPWLLRQEAETKDAQIKDLQNELRDMKNKHSEMQEVLDDAERRVEEKELLQSRHRVLTDESGGLQRDLSNAQSTIRELQGVVDDLSNDLRSERQMLEGKRGELLSAKEDLRITKREEAALKNKVQSLEDEITVLQASLEEEQEQHNLDDARKREKSWLQRDADQKASVRNCQARIAELERELHSTLMKKFEAESPKFSPSEKLHDEVRDLRRQLTHAHRTLRDLKTKNRELERAAMRDEDQKDLHELLKSSTLEAETLSLKLSERDARLNDLKALVQRIREERAFCVKKAQTANEELDALQTRYDQAMDQLSTAGNKSKHEKEVRGLGKEIVWLRARLRREQRFRHDLAWSKGLMELGERVRVACNQTDLRMIADIGVKPHDGDNTRNPRQKLKSAISTVVAAVRFRRMAQKWEKTKKLGEGLKRAKDDVLMSRNRGSKLVN